MKAVAAFVNLFIASVYAAIDGGGCVLDVTSFFHIIRSVMLSVLVGLRSALAIDWSPGIHAAHNQKGSACQILPPGYADSLGLYAPPGIESCVAGTGRVKFLNTPTVAETMGLFGGHSR
jgi:hypothetical protein